MLKPRPVYLLYHLIPLKDSGVGVLQEKVPAKFLGDIGNATFVESNLCFLSNYFYLSCDK